MGTALAAAHSAVRRNRKQRLKFLNTPLAFAGALPHGPPSARPVTSATGSWFVRVGGAVAGAGRSPAVEEEVPKAAASAAASSVLLPPPPLRPPPLRPLLLSPPLLAWGEAAGCAEAACGVGRRGGGGGAPRKGASLTPAKSSDTRSNISSRRPTISLRTRRDKEANCTGLSVV